MKVGIGKEGSKLLCCCHCSRKVFHFKISFKSQQWFSFSGCQAQWKVKVIADQQKWKMISKEKKKKSNSKKTPCQQLVRKVLRGKFCAVAINPKRFSFENFVHISVVILRLHFKRKKINETFTSKKLRFQVFKWGEATTFIADEGKFGLQFKKSLNSQQNSPFSGFEVRWIDNPHCGSGGLQLKSSLKSQ